MCSTETQDARNAIEHLSALLDPRHLQGITESLAAAARRFAVQSVTPVNQHVFHRTIGDFVAHLYRYGLPLPQALAPSQARAEAIHILETGYRNGDVVGYDGALCDAVRFGVEGIEWILAVILDLVRMREQRKHVHLAYSRFLVGRPWSQRRNMAAVLLHDDEESFLPQACQHIAAHAAADIAFIIEMKLRHADLFDRLAPSLRSVSIWNDSCRHAAWNFDVPGRGHGGFRDFGHATVWPKSRGVA